jgi:hypothetical protein
MDTGKPYLFSSGTSLTIQVFDDLDIHPCEVPQAQLLLLRDATDTLQAPLLFHTMFLSFFVITQAIL